MNIERVSEALNIEPWRIKGALDRRTIQLVREFVPNYMVFKKDLGDIERGTSVFLTEELEVIRGFPKIKRAFYLRPVIQGHFSEEVAVEEKMNGYNIRAFSLQGKIYALTRGGYICPYTTARLRDSLEIREYFKSYDGVLCGEAVGRENPYVVHEYEEAKKFGFFVFDIREKVSNKPMPIQERNSLLDPLGIHRVRLLGIFKKEEAAEEVFRILEELEKENREGVVLKDPEMVIPPIKYTSSRTNTSDLEYAFKFPYDYGRDFFFSRIMREGYQALEMSEGRRELRSRALRLGKSLLYPMVETMRKIKEREVVTEDYIVRVKSRGEIDDLLEYLKRQGVNCMLGDVRKEDGEIVAEIKRLRHASNDKIRAMLRGKME
jgi:putative ATP-dependent DNA ligase